MFRNLCLLLCCFNAALLCSAQSKLIGGAAHYKGEYVVLYQLSDALSGQRIFVEKQLINAKGDFEFVLNNKEITPYYLTVGSQTGLVYVEPNKTYTLEIPEPAKNTYQRLEGTEVDLILKKTNEKELNLAIRKFNQLYFEFIDQHYYDFAAGAYVGNDQLKERIRTKAGDETRQDTLSKAAIKPTNFPAVVEQFRSEIDSIFADHFDNEYFNDYVSFSISEIELLAGLSRKVYYETYLMSRSLPYLNPAFGSAFKLYYKNAFVDLKKEVQVKLIKAVNLEHNAQQMIEAMSGDSITKSLEIRALVCLNILREAKSNGQLTEPACLLTLENFKSHSNELVKNLAEQILIQKTQYKVGWALENFTLVDTKGNKWVWSEQEAVSTYFLFFATWSPTSLKELALLNRLQIQYGDQIRFIAINMDSDVELMKKYMAEHKDQKIMILSGLGDPMLGVKTNMKSIPHAVWLDESGRFMVNYTRKPSEGLEMDLKKYIATLNSGNKSGVKTWKGQ